jgi:uncharacterized phage-associated protein
LVISNWVKLDYNSKRKNFYRRFFLLKGGYKVMETINSSKKYRNVANKMIELFKQDNQPISHKKLQKLVYLTYAFYYYFNDKKLFEEKFEAWPHGPVCRELYFDIKNKAGNNYNAFNISNIKLEVESENPEDEEEIKYNCNYVKQYFGDWSANSLEYLTHKSGSAWSKVINKDNDDIEEPYLDSKDIINDIKKIVDEYSVSKKDTTNTESDTECRQ